jgi:enoyl-CoA hydratase/carnithine racemase
LLNTQKHSPEGYMSKLVQLEFDGPVARLTLSRPPVNALDAPLVAEIHRALDSVETREGISVVIIRSDQKAFCAGADLSVIGSFLESGDPGQALRQYASSVQQLLGRIERLPAVTVCEIRGSAMGGGLEMALAADFRIASSRAKFGLPEAALGLIPAAGGTQRLARQCGIDVGRRMILAGQVMTAEQAHACGLVSEVHAEAEFAQKFDAFVFTLSSQSSNALRAAKLCLAQAQPMSELAFCREVEEIGELISQRDTQERLQAFLNRSR